MDNSLSGKDYRDIVIDVGLNALPIVGGSLSALYFGVKQEKRFKRIENFYEGLKNKVELIEEHIVDLNKLDKSKLAVIIEEINESIEMDFAEQRIEYLQNCFLNTLTKIKQDYDKQRYFISIITKLTDLDISILRVLYNAPEKHGMSYSNEKDSYEYNATLEKLKSYGLVNSFLNGKLKQNINWGEITLFTISEFGNEFVNYCLESKLNN